MDHRQSLKNNLTINTTLNAFETIHEDEKDQDLELQDQKNPIQNKDSENENFPKNKTTKIKQKYKSMLFLNNNSSENLCLDDSKSKKRSKSLIFSDKMGEALNLKELLSLENLENDCFSLLKLLIDANLNLFKDFQNKISSHCKRINRNLLELNDFLSTKELNTENLINILKKERFFNNEILDYYKDYLLNASEIVIILNEENNFAQKVQHLCESQESEINDKDIEIKNKLEEIVKLHQNIIELEKKEISFEENINEIYEKYMMVIEDKDFEDQEKWKKLDRFKKFTRSIENLVQEKLQVKSQNREIEQMNKEMEDMAQTIKEIQKENQRKTECFILFIFIKDFMLIF